MSDLVMTKAKDLRTGDRVKLDGVMKRVRVQRILSDPDRLPAVMLTFVDHGADHPLVLDRFETVFRAPRRRSPRKAQTSN